MRALSEKHKAKPKSSITIISENIVDEYEII